MADVQTTGTRTGLLSTPDGLRNSSGRLMKLWSVAMASGLAIGGVISQHDAMPYVLAFLGLAGGAEAVQKITGK